MFLRTPGLILPLIALGAATAPMEAGVLPCLNELGDLPGGIVLTFGNDISDDGLVVAGSAGSARGPVSEAFRWEGGAITGLGGLGGPIIGFGFLSGASAVSPDGSLIVGVASSPAGLEAFRWSATEGMIGLGDLEGGAFDSAATAMSADGSVIAGSGASVNGPEAFHWADGIMTGLGDLAGGAVHSSALGCSENGDVIVGFASSALGLEAFRWSEGSGMIGLGDLPGGMFNSSALACSGDGSVVVGRGTSAQGTEAFRWTAGGGMLGLGDLPGGAINSEALAVSANGSIIIGTATTASGPRAFIWDSVHGLRDLADALDDSGIDSTGWQLQAARGLSPDGTIIVGQAINPLGQSTGFRVRWLTSETVTMAASASESILDLAVQFKGQPAQHIALQLQGEIGATIGRGCGNGTALTLQTTSVSLTPLESTFEIALPGGGAAVIRNLVISQPLSGPPGFISGGETVLDGYGLGFNYSAALPEGAAGIDDFFLFILGACVGGFEGACCGVESGFPTCVENQIPSGCSGNGKQYAGALTSCADNLCGDPPRACCLPDGSCTIATKSTCDRLAGLFTLSGDCAIACNLAGACCLGVGRCELSLRARDCEAAGGSFLGILTVCGDGSCQTGACCTSDGDCFPAFEPEDCTLNHGGVFQGVGTSCAPNPCSSGADQGAGSPRGEASRLGAGIHFPISDMSFTLDLGLGAGNPTATVNGVVIARLLERCAFADLNCDTLVNGADLGILLLAWGACSGCPADLDSSGEIDGADLGLLLLAWSA
jgi:probable HAF family extracellular repeat protein